MEKIDHRAFAWDSAKLEAELIATVVCPVTNRELYFSAGSERVYMIDSLGECADCGKHFHVSALHNGAKISLSEWPVFYTGYYCNECYDKEDEEVKLTEEEKKNLQMDIDEEEEE